MGRKNNRRIGKRSYRNASAKRQRLRKEAQKQVKYARKPICFGSPILRQSRQRGT